MAGPASDETRPPSAEAGDLPPNVRELVASVRDRVSRSATVSDIRALADEAAAHAAGNITTVEEIRRLMDVAVDRAQKISGLMGRLADLAGDGDPEAP